MIGVFILALTPMMRVGLCTVLTTSKIQVVGGVSTPAELMCRLAEINGVVMADEKLLQELQPAITETERPALIVLSNDSHRLWSDHTLMAKMCIFPIDMESNLSGLPQFFFFQQEFFKCSK
jgi:hypothetical protein